MAGTIQPHWRKGNGDWHLFIWNPQYSGKELGHSIAQMSICGQVSTGEYDRVTQTIFTDKDRNVCQRCLKASGRVRVPVEHE